MSRTNLVCFVRRCAKPGGQGQGFRGLPTTEAQIPPTSPISSASKRRVTPGRLHGLSRDPEHCRPAHKLGTVELGPLNQETYTRTPSPRGHDSSTRKSRSPLSLHVSTRIHAPSYSAIPCSCVRTRSRVAPAPASESTARGRVLVRGPGGRPQQRRTHRRVTSISTLSSGQPHIFSPA